MTNKTTRDLLWNTTPGFGLREAVDVPALSLRGWISGIVIRQDGWAYQLDSDGRDPIWLPESDLEKIPLTVPELRDEF